MEVLQTSRQSQNSSTIAYTGSFFNFLTIFSCRAANKEVQRVIGTINDGPLYLLGALTSIAILCEERAQISRYVRSYAADHGVAFPDFLNTDEGQLHHTKLCLLSSKQIAR